MAPERQKPITTQGNDIRQTLGLDQSNGKKKSVKKWFWGTGVIVVIAILVWQMWSSSQSQTLQYKTANVSRGSLSITVTATGTLQPVNQVEVGSEISGTIKTVLVDFNDYVKKGQILANMNTDQLQTKVNQAKAYLDSAKAQVKQVEATILETHKALIRYRELVNKGLYSIQELDISQASYDRAIANLTSAKALVAQSQAALDAELTTLAKATIHSPIDGIVLIRDVEPGQTMAASFQTPVMFTLAENLAQMELHVDVDEADVGQIMVGQEASFTVDAYADKNFPATITDIHFASQTIDGVVTYETVLSVDNSALLLRPGMTATADILVKKIQNTLLVPNAALRFKPSKEDTNTTNQGGFMKNIMPRPPSISKTQVDTNDIEKDQQQVWTLRDNQPVAINVSTGSTNGINTEITSGDIINEMPLIIDTVSNQSE
ncbi:MULTISPECIES: efflux RND transporter periplasmic adaptor subunit [Shewanella]|uniref:Efflux RND transporter periplasmic adaptor subunit n=1 Tax=Shewanella polaris TaxID=2588449 RepID=A0A4Y5YES4_9GAMM|nr:MULTISPECIES: efflux RND transporter periplasmic adaptor subunit [Shewanella]QDE31098.1 efflux RND transporter periplasmic adaptor subunit [Shewanella polaris]